MIFETIYIIEDFYLIIVSDFFIGKILLIHQVLVVIIL